MSKPVKKDEVQTAKPVVFDITRLDDEKIEDVFTSSFQGLADDYQNNLTISEFETKVVRPVGSRNLKVEVKIFGMADVTSRNDVHNKKTKAVHPALRKVAVQVSDKGVADFVFEDSADLNTNDYVLYYSLFPIMKESSV